jgi:O-antigen ligase
VLAAVILITWPTTTALRLVVLLAGALALLPWTVDRLRRAERVAWWTWAPLMLGLSLVAWSLISAVGSGAPWALSLYGWYGRDNGLLMLLGVVTLLATGAALRKREVGTALWWVTGAASLAALVSVGQALGVDMFANPLGYGGANSLLGNPNFAAGFFAITTLVAAGLTLGSSGKVRIVGGVAAALQVVGLVLATSQQGPAALVVGLIAGAVLVGLSSSRQVLRPVAAAIGGLAVVGAAVLGALLLAGGGPLAAILRTDTLAVRVEYWKASWATMLGLPAFGTGPDGLSRYIAEFRPESYVAAPGLGPATRVDSAHNVALQFGATLGLVGLILWIAFALSVTVLIVWLAWGWARRHEAGLPWLLVTVGAAWVAYLTQSLVSIDMVVLVALGWTLAGMAVALVRSAVADPLDCPPTGGKRKVAMSARRPETRLIAASVALGVLGAAIAVPGYLAERTPTVGTLEEAQQVLASGMTPCPVRLSVLNSLAPQVDLPTYQDLARIAAGADPRCPPLTAIYADVALEAGDLPVADAQSVRAIELDPLDYQAWLLRARVLSAEGDAEGARQAYGEAVRLAAVWPGSDLGAVESMAADLGLS